MLTTQDLIKILPFKDDFKDRLLEKFDTLTPDQKFSIERIVWDFYDAIYQARLDKNMQIALEQAKRKDETLDHTFYERIRQQTDKELQMEYSETATDVDLSSAREELEEIIQRRS